MFFSQLWPLGFQIACLEGSQTSRAPLLELQQKQYQEQKLYDERMNALREKVDRVRAGLRDFNEREIRRFDEESKPI